MGISIVRQERDGIEFFTVEDSGESGMSVSGLALCCGVSKQKISRLLKSLEDLSTDRLSKWLKPLQGKELYLSGLAAKRGGVVRIVKDEVCAAVITHFAFSSEEVAQDSLLKFSQAGIRTWIHQITGWTPERQSTIALLTDVIQRDPLPWERHFSEEWIRNAERLTGYRWEWRVMGKFINRCVYDYMPAEVRKSLDEWNPADENGNRANKQHQHFKENASEILKSHIRTVNDLMQASISEDQFDDLMQARFKGVYQLALKLDKAA